MIILAMSHIVHPALCVPYRIVLRVNQGPDRCEYVVLTQQFLEDGTVGYVSGYYTDNWEVALQRFAEKVDQLKHDRPVTLEYLREWCKAELKYKGVQE